MLDTLEALLQTIEKGAQNNQITLPNVELFCNEWRKEIYLNKTFGKLPLATVVEQLQTLPLAEAIAATKKNLLFTAAKPMQPGKLYIIEAPKIIKQ